MAEFDFSCCSLNDQGERRGEEKTDYRSLRKYLNNHEHFLKSVCKLVVFFVSMKIKRII